MGYRTVVMLSNDRHSEWSNDKELGKKISVAMNMGGNGELPYGSVVQCVHADVQTLAAMDMYDGFKVLASDSWKGGKESADEIVLKLLKEAAAKLGYTLRKKPIKA